MNKKVLHDLSKGNFLQRMLQKNFNNKNYLIINVISRKTSKSKTKFMFNCHTNNPCNVIICNFKVSDEKGKSGRNYFNGKFAFAN
jgi:hypothetical protein